MTGLSMVHLPLALGAFRRWAGTRELGEVRVPGPGGRTARVSFDEGRALHHLLAEMVGPGLLHPFRLMVTGRDGRAPTNGNLYAYTRADAAALRRAMEETAPPELLGICNPADLAVKPMPDSWTACRRLGFDLRVRPVRRLGAPVGVFPKGAEVDAYLLEALRRFPDSRADDEENSMRSAGRSRQAVYADWLAERLAGAATLEMPTVRLVHFERHRAARRKRAPKGLEGPDAVLQGVLRIVDPVAFADRLGRAVGRHGAYGYGMLLLRPAGG